MTGCAATPPVSPWLATRSGGPHDMGEIWAVTVWEARRNLVAKHGAATGNELMLQLLTDSLFLLQRNPTFIEARDAILAADLARTGGDNRCELWRGFAKRGMGLGAATPTSGSFTEDFTFPDDCVAPPAAAYSYAGTRAAQWQRAAAAPMPPGAAPGPPRGRAARLPCSCLLRRPPAAFS